MTFVGRGIMLGAVVVVGLAACTQQSGPVEPLESIVSRVVASGPDREAREYRPPSRETAEAVAASVAELLTTGGVGRLPGDYQLEPTTAGPDDPINALVEQGRPTAGNGLYAARGLSNSRPALVIQIPHPVADKHTETMGTQLFAETSAQLFMLAGAHRNAGDDSDVAHSGDTTFAAVNDAVVQSGTTVIQLHGFSSAKHDDYGDVVLSSTVDDPSPLVRRLAQDLTANGFDTCVYNGKKCKALGATTNVQAAQARAVGADFIHIEVDRDIRDSSSKRAELVRVIGQTLRSAGVG